MPFEPESNEAELDGLPETEGVEGETGPDSELGSEPDGEGLPATGVESDAAFYDASKVPESLRPTFREMQASYTKKMQDFAAKIRDADTVKQRAGLFDQLMSDPRVVDYLRRLASGQAGDSEVGNQVEVDEETQKILKTATSPIENRLQQMEMQMTLERERQRFVGEHPTWEQEVGGANGIARAWSARPENSNMTMEQAYRWVMHDKLKAELADLKKRANAGRARVEGKGSPRGVVPGDGKVPQTVEEAARLAVQQLNLGNNPEYRF